SEVHTADLLPLPRYGLDAPPARAGLSDGYDRTIEYVVDYRKAFRQMKVFQLLKGEWLLQMTIIILLYESIQFEFKFHDFLEIEFQSQGFEDEAMGKRILQLMLRFEIASLLP
nr:hypothetical protein [Tanacetum cinerariifolium]